MDSLFRKCVLVGSTTAKPTVRLGADWVRVRVVWVKAFDPVVGSLRIYRVLRRGQRLVCADHLLNGTNAILLIDL